MILIEVVPNFESEIGNVKAIMPKRPFLMYARSYIVRRRKILKAKLKCRKIVQ